MFNLKELENKAIEIRKRTLEIIFNASGGYTGGSLSSIDILTALYFHVLRIDPLHPDDPGHERFLISNGHSVKGYYCVTIPRGFLSDDLPENKPSPGQTGTKGMGFNGWSFCTYGCVWLQ